MRSADNADLASGYANVVVLSPLGGRSQAPPEAGQFEGLRRPPEWGTDLGSQVEALRNQGSHVEVITPDAASRAAMGTNQMDPATRIPAARAGFAQGKQEASASRSSDDWPPQPDWPLPFDASTPQGSSAARESARHRTVRPNRNWTSRQWGEMTS